MTQCPAENCADDDTGNCPAEACDSENRADNCPGNAKAGLFVIDALFGTKMLNKIVVVSVPHLSRPKLPNSLGPKRPDDSAYDYDDKQ